MNDINHTPPDEQPTKTIPNPVKPPYEQPQPNPQPDEEPAHEKPDIQPNPTEIPNKNISIVNASLQTYFPIILHSNIINYTCVNFAELNCAVD